MRGIGGNIKAVIQTATASKNEIGETMQSWADAQSLKGWIDQLSGEARYSSYNAKIQESTHVFICDYAPLRSDISAENARMIIGGKRYDIMLIDNPMELKHGSQWEFYLRYTGGQ